MLKTWFSLLGIVSGLFLVAFVLTKLLVFLLATLPIWVVTAIMIVGAATIGTLWVHYLEKME